MNYTQHEISAFWPAMSEPEFRALVADIAANGQHNEIWLYQGEVLDGWHRARACDELGIPPKTREYTGTSPNKFANSQNGPRRHLPESVRAICATKAAQWRPHGDQGAILNFQDRGQTSAQIAESVQVSVSHIESAKAVIASGLDGEVMAGKIGLRPAAELARKAPEVAARVVAKEITPEQGKAELKERETKPAPRTFGSTESEKFAELQAEKAKLEAALADKNAEIIALELAGVDEGARNEAMDKMQGYIDAIDNAERMRKTAEALLSEANHKANELVRANNTLDAQNKKLKARIAELEKCAK